MTEQEWLVCNDPGEMLRTFTDHSYRRKLMLFASACCYRIWDLLPKPESRQVVGILELYADGVADREDLDRACAAADEVHRSIKHPAKRSAAFAVSRTRLFTSVYGNLPINPEDIFSWARNSRQQTEAIEASIQSDLLRCIFGNPFRPTTIDSSWLTWSDQTIPSLSQAIYQERTFADLPILADALEDAGCADATILAHLRSPGPHARGCHILDLLLGKS